MQHPGGCLCGSIRYRFSHGEYPVANCHCSMCRRASAAPFVTWVVVPLTAFVYTRGTPARYVSSTEGVRYYCADCGTPLACTLKRHPDVIDVTVCSLDDPESFVPRAAVFEDTKLSWLTDTEAHPTAGA